MTEVLIHHLPIEMEISDIQTHMKLAIRFRSFSLVHIREVNCFSFTGSIGIVLMEID